MAKFRLKASFKFSQKRIIRRVKQPTDLKRVFLFTRFKYKKGTHVVIFIL